MLPPPINGFVDFDFLDRLGKAMLHGDRQPLPALSGLNAIAILPLVLFELNIIEKTKDIGLADLVKISDPG